MGQEFMTALDTLRVISRGNFFLNPLILSLSKDLAHFEVIPKKIKKKILSLNSKCARCFDIILLRKITQHERNKITFIMFRNSVLLTT